MNNKIISTHRIAVSETILAPAQYELDQLLGMAFSDKASDLVLQIGHPPKIKKEGQLISIDGPKITHADVEFYKQRILAERYHLLKDNTDIDTSYFVPEGRLRVNIGKERGNYFMVFRLVNTVIPEYSTLSMPDDPHILEFMRNKRGLVLVTGPVGSGKSTTLASMIRWRTSQIQSTVVTIEDPIEYIHQDYGKGSVFIQREIGRDVPNFATGLRQALRQNPDIIMVGEMRDLDTVETALNAAISGHLVLGTLHTISTIQTVDRLSSLFPAGRQEDVRMQLSLALRGILSQALIPLTTYGQDQLGKARIPCIELLPIGSDDLRGFIRKGEPYKIRQVIETKLKTGAYPFDRYLLHLVEKGLVDHRVALEYSQEPDVFVDSLKRLGY